MAYSQAQINLFIAAEDGVAPTLPLETGLLARKTAIIIHVEKQKEEIHRLSKELQIAKADGESARVKLKASETERASELKAANEARAGLRLEYEDTKIEPRIAEGLRKIEEKYARKRQRALKVVERCVKPMV